MKKYNAHTIFMCITLSVMMAIIIPNNGYARSHNNYKTADTELNRVYRAVTVKYKNNKAFLQKLKESQRLWIQFRDAEVAMRYPAENKKMAYGSSYPMCAEALLAELTQARIKTLRQWLDGAVEGDVCSGSIGF